VVRKSGNGGGEGWGWFAVVPAADSGVVSHV